MLACEWWLGLIDTHIIIQLYRRTTTVIHNCKEKDEQRLRMSSGIGHSK